VLPNNSPWQAKQSIPHTTVTVKMREDFASNSDDKGTGCCITTTHCLASFFTRDFLTKNMTVVPHPLYFSVTLIEDKTEWPPF
jgi:hypothetical protein